MRLKRCDGHLTCKFANKCLNVRGQVEVVEWDKRWAPSFSLLSCESSVSLKENPDWKKKKKILFKRLKCSADFFYHAFTEHLLAYLSNSTYVGHGLFKIIQNYIKNKISSQNFLVSQPCVSIDYGLISWRFFFLFSLIIFYLSYLASFLSPFL